MIIIGLTGSIACGKSTVSKIFQNKGLPVIDADLVARKVVEVGSEGLEKIKNTFGSKYISLDGSLNRTELGYLVFKEPLALKKINKLMQPLMKKETANQFLELEKSNTRLAIYDAALIIENGGADLFKSLIVVSCSLDIQLERLMKRNSLSKEDAILRISQQLSSREKEKFATMIIDTSGTLEETEKQTLEIFNIIKNY